MIGFMLLFVLIGMNQALRAQTNPSSIFISAYVTPNKTVTLQAYNAGDSATTLAPNTYKVRLIL